MSMNAILALLPASVASLQEGGGEGPPGGVLIPLAVLGLAAYALRLNHNAKLRRADLIEKAIELGAPVGDLSLSEEKPRLPYRKGMIMGSIGFAFLLVAESASKGAEESARTAGSWFGLVGGLLFLIGIALVLNDFINRKRLSGEG